MSTLFINASPNENGNTARLAAKLLDGKKHRTLNLVDYKVYAYGQSFSDDQFGEVIDAIRAADDIVIGSPMYWHSMAGALRNVLDRSYGTIDQGSLAGRRLWFVFQGAAPTQQQLAAGEFTMSRYAALYGMQYMGMVTTPADIAKVARDFSE
ncbi:MAG: flavodoxin family protein [Tractidigestivibacter sp.]|jgi:multimeric flavodoxin WrbA|uniref:flavodoxin family protein n=1 Tax=Tractidigestivibacter sp. TaxID=2847320 RepID=UPI003D8B994B